MDNQIIRLNEIKDCYIREQKRNSNELAGLPDGKLQKYSSKGNSQFVITDYKEGKLRRRGINSKPEIIRQLARKEYLNALDSRLSTGIIALSNAIDNCSKVDAKLILDSLNKNFASLPSEWFFAKAGDTCTEFDFYSDEALAARMEIHRTWANAPYAKSTYPFGDYAQISSRGERVRSQRELLISEKLYAYGVPFRYEPVIEIGNIVLSPDFGFQDAFNKEFYLEYCGMMDNKKYLENFLSKREKYEAVGINEWTNMIYAFSNGPNINVAQIDYIIETLIIPRL